MTAISAVIRALDWPPLRMVRGCGLMGSPVSVLASSTTLFAVSPFFPLLFACILRKSSTDMSAKEMHVLGQLGHQLLPGSVLRVGSGCWPLISILRPEGVSPWANCSMSAISVLFPDPVGPTIPMISPLTISTSFTASARPSLSAPPIIVKSRVSLTDCHLSKNSTASSHRETLRLAGGVQGKILFDSGHPSAGDVEKYDIFRINSADSRCLRPKPPPLRPERSGYRCLRYPRTETPCLCWPPGRLFRRPGLRWPEGHP